MALNCVANSRLHREGPFERIWVQPAAGDAGTALGAALSVAAAAGEPVAPMPNAYLGRGWTDDELEAWLRTARWPYERPASLADAVAAELAADGIVAWFQGRSEYGPRALGGRSLLAHPGRKENLDRLNAVKGREEFRPVAPMVLTERAAEIFSDGPLPSPYMLFTHRSPPAGGTASQRWCTWTAPPGCRRWIAPSSRCWPRCWTASPPVPGCRWWSTPA